MVPVLQNCPLYGDEAAPQESYQVAYIALYQFEMITSPDGISKNWNRLLPFPPVDVATSG